MTTIDRAPLWDLLHPEESKIIRPLNSAQAIHRLIILKLSNFQLAFMVQEGAMQTTGER